MEQKREFTGVWIPYYVLEDTRLSGREKLLYADIASFKKCFKSNQTLANQFGCTTRTIQMAIKKLKDLGYVVELGFDGRKRYLQTRNTVHPWGEENFTSEVSISSPIDNNIDNNISSDSEESREKEESESSSVGGKTEYKTVPVDDDGNEISQRKPATTTRDAPKVFRVFQNSIGVNNPGWMRNRTERQAAQSLYETKGVEKIKKALAFWLEHKSDPFLPDLTSPYKLESKWEALLMYRKKRGL